MDDTHTITTTYPWEQPIPHAAHPTKHAPSRARPALSELAWYALTLAVCATVAHHISPTAAKAIVAVSPVPIGAVTWTLIADYRTVRP